MTDLTRDAVLGFIGGSGIYEIDGLTNTRWETVESPFGTPSDQLLFGELDGQKLVFLPRHGRGHKLNPSGINYRANIDVMKRCGVTDILAISAVGSLREDIAPGDFVAVDQFIDRTVLRERSFFGPGIAAHVGLADPVCPRLSGLAADAAAQAGANVHRAGCYIAIEGPQFSTRAESRMFQSWGADVIGMTAMPEARLAREAELPYALLAMVTDFDCWREGEAAVEVGAVLQVMRANAARARDAVRRLVAALPPERAASPIDRALDGAIITSHEGWNPQQIARLDAIAGRILHSTPDE